MRGLAIGFILRLITSVVISLTVWWLFITPFDRLPLPAAAVTAIIRVLDFPVALAGEILPIRGVELVFPDQGTWCDFCQAGEVFRMQMRLAIPVYLFLLYLPAWFRWLARRESRLFKRIVIGLLIYAVFTTTYFLVTGDGDRHGDMRIAAMWLLILAAAAAVAWSGLTGRAKAAGIAAVLLLGAWAFPFMMTFIAPKMDAVQPYYVSYLVLLILGVGGTLWLTWAIEQGIDWAPRPGRRGSSLTE